MYTFLGEEILLNVTFSIESNIYLKITDSYETNLLNTILHKKIGTELVFGTIYSISIHTISSFKYKTII